MVERGKKEKSFFITRRGGAKGALGVPLPISHPGSPSFLFCSMNFINNYWMRLSMVWRIMHIDDAVIKLWITALWDQHKSSYHTKVSENIYRGVLLLQIFPFKRLTLTYIEWYFFVYSCYHFLVNNSAISSLHDCELCCLFSVLRSSLKQ